MGKSTVTAFVGDGFIRPEITSLCVNGRCLPRIDERAYLGTDKSVPYKKPCKSLQQTQYLNLRFVSAVLRSLGFVPLCELLCENLFDK
ncbi:MAG: hypothetical protein FWG87_07140 [Defluviitaleaceae bacterium]|nr:hypothetical protein [Defluviitaleaceae bacterium]